MLKVVLDYQAVVLGDIFVRFSKFEIIPKYTRYPEVEKIEVEVPDETPLKICVTFSKIESVEKAKRIGREIVRKILDRLAFLHSLSIEDPGEPQGTFEYLDGPQADAQGITSSITLKGSFSGKQVDNLDRDPALVNHLKSDLEKENFNGESHFSLFRSAARGTDPVESFMGLYSILLLLNRNSKGKEDQAAVDNFILNHSQDPVPQTLSPHKPGVMETVFSRLRNEIAHSRGVPIEQTQNEMASYRNQLMGLVKISINNSKICPKTLLGKGNNRSRSKGNSDSGSSS